MRKNKKKNSPLTLRERTIIEVRYRDGNSIRNIAKEVGKNPSTVSREIAGKPSVGIGKYIADVSHREALQRIAKRGNKYKLDKNEDLKEYMINKMKIGRVERRSSLPSIESRPKIVEKRSRIGDWEDDLVVSKKSKDCIKSVNERKSGIVLFGKTKNGTAKICDKVLFNKLSVIPSKYLNTLTRDNGGENKDYENVEKELNIKVYYAHPYHSWERGSNENCNGLLRRLFPKGTDWSKVTDEEITKAEYLINTRPRKRFNGQTPAEMFFKETGVALFS